MISYVWDSVSNLRERFQGSLLEGLYYSYR